MRVYIDIGHPAHVHYFRNFIRLMQAKEHEFFVSARERSIIHYLLNHFKISFYNRGKGKKGIFGKLWYMFIADIRLYNQARKFKPDIFISFASPYAAQVSWILGKPHVVLDDTEHARFGHMLYKPFSTIFLNPKCFRKDFGPRQIRFNSFTELFYLHSNQFSPDNRILSQLNLKPGEKYVLLRFVSWEANHDLGHSGLNITTRKQLVNMCIEKGYKVFISNEADRIDPIFKPYLISIPPEQMHNALKYCELLVSESGTMASEAAILATPVIYVNSLPLMGYLEEEQNEGLLFHFPSSEKVVEKADEILSTPDFNEVFESRCKKMLEDKIDITSFLVWFVENYPESVKIMKENPEYQGRFS
jgi:uncharacterized protein